MATTMDKRVYIWKFLLVICALFKGLNGRSTDWINARATFYGGNQNPSTLGKIGLINFRSIFNRWTFFFLFKIFLIIVC